MSKASEVFVWHEGISELYICFIYNYRVFTGFRDVWTPTELHISAEKLRKGMYA